MFDAPKTFSGDLADPPPALSALCQQARWVGWRWERGKNGKWTKPPYIARNPGLHASTSDAQTWGSRRDAVAAVLSGKVSGVGFCLKDSDIGAIDLDKCRNIETGQIDDWAQAIIDGANGAYVEITPSGTGLRIIGLASGPEVHRVNGPQPAASPWVRAGVASRLNCTPDRRIAVSAVFWTTDGLWPRKAGAAICALMSTRPATLAS
jgi:hypothetical protein